MKIVHSSPSFWSDSLSQISVVQMKILSLTVLASVIVAISAGDYDYGEVVGLSLLFYEAQRTGVLPPTNRIPWRWDSFTTDVGEEGEDLTGGFFDGKPNSSLKYYGLIFLKFIQLETTLK